METLTEDDLKKLIESTPAAVLDLTMKSLVALTTGNKALSDAWALCGLSAITTDRLATALLTERAKVADLEKQLEDVKAELAIATGKMTAPVVS